MPHTRFRYAVTFEYLQDATETIRGEIVVSNASLGARRALEAARKALPNRHWSSVVILLERAAVEIRVSQGAAASRAHGRVDLTGGVG